MTALRIPLMHARDLESVLPPTNDERIAAWALRYFRGGHHRNPGKPRIRVKVPDPLAQPSAPVSDPPIGCDPLNRAARSDGSGDYQQARAYAMGEYEPDDTPASYEDIRG